jgi:hypothetical protein
MPSQGQRCRATGKGGDGMSKFWHDMVKGGVQGLCLYIFISIMKPDLFDSFWMPALVWFSLVIFVRMDRWEWKKDE